MSNVIHRLSNQAKGFAEQWNELWDHAPTKREHMRLDQLNRTSNVLFFAVEALEQHETTIDLQKSLLDAIAELNDEKLWVDSDFDGHTEHIQRTAGLALALSEGLMTAFEAHATKDM
tara:strand:+ start:2402 stop:2752 length:351 start_codon:yes stop_codon:yes gene_type:complete